MIPPPGHAGGEAEAATPDPSVAERVDAVRRLFEEQHGGEPDGVWSAPGRVNLIGDHTDYNDGFVLPLALQHRAYVAARRRTDGRLRLASAGHGAADLEWTDVGPGRPAGWPAYVVGPWWVLRERATLAAAPHPTDGGVDAVLLSDVPVGGGLSSSAAVGCASLLAGRDLWGGPEDRTELALLAQEAENVVAGVPCGVMDQSAALRARAGHLLALDTRSLRADHIPFRPDQADLALVVLDTHAPHRLADGAYAERRAACEEAARRLGVPTLRDCDPSAVAEAASVLGPVLTRRARHVTTENDRVLRTVELLRSGDVAAVGPILTEGQASLREDFETSVPEIDAAVEAALAGGALGARMTGGGFGGCTVSLVRAEGVPAMVDTVRHRFAAAGFAAPSAFVAHASQGATAHWDEGSVSGSR